MERDAAAVAEAWDARYREQRDGWELGRPAPPLEAFLRRHPLAPRPPGVVLVPGCGRGHEAALLADLGFSAVGVDVSGEAVRRARQLHGARHPGIRWLQRDLFDGEGLARQGLDSGSLDGVLEHTCFCAIDPAQRQAYIATAARLLRPGGWLLGLFWCHGRPGGPPWGSDPAAIAGLCRAAGLRQELWQPAEDSVPQREHEWIGLWRREALSPAVPQRA
ncbi:methyltransferase domain-containing protein [Cyanobium sp. NIES-981]|uniref:methyltransferase domain-containing protein n=1 Tax=Cyanobium sp. NIES-981 TaxID=1851505 RepID=UPI0007DCEA71|nr:methyltransferase domain-containing protein [Cyanobium sp. NIES-981]SBO44448.1 Thiopurine S-methyltransferase [Cyanobium sp. NIES-981]